MCKAISEVESDKNGEIRLADAIEQLIGRDCKVYSLELNPTEKRIGIGTAQSYTAMLKSIILGK